MMGMFPIGQGSLANVYSHGIEDYNNSGPAQAINNGSHTALLNDGAGAFTNLAYKIPGRGNMWNTTTHRLDFAAAGLILGDTVEIRIDANIITSGANRDISLGIELAEGGFPYSLTVATTPFKSAGTYPEVRWVSVYMGDLNTLSNPAYIWAQSDGNGDTIEFNGTMMRTALRQPIYA